MKSLSKLYAHSILPRDIALLNFDFDPEQLTKKIQKIYFGLQLYFSCECY